MWLFAAERGFVSVAVPNMGSHGKSPDALQCPYLPHLGGETVPPVNLSVQKVKNEYGANGGRVHPNTSAAAMIFNTDSST